MLNLDKNASKENSVSKSPPKLKNLNIKNYSRDNDLDEETSPVLITAYNA